MCASRMYLWRIYGRITGLRIPLFSRCLIMGRNSTQHFVKIFWITTFQVKQQWRSILPHEGLISRFIAEILCSFVVFFWWLTCFGGTACSPNEWMKAEWVNLCAWPFVVMIRRWSFIKQETGSTKTAIQKKEPLILRGVGGSLLAEGTITTIMDQLPVERNMLTSSTCS